MSGTRRGARPLVGALAGALLVAAAATAEVDPFYLDREHDARAALAAGDAHAAARLYRIACFGMLDEPARLGGCLARLAIAQGRDGDAEGFGETFRRLATVEERFQGLTQAELAAAERLELAGLAGDLLTPQEVALLPAVAAEVERARAKTLEGLAPKERIRRLEALAAKQPQEPRWPLALARAELERGEPKAALDRLRGLDAPEARPQVSTLRGVALARLDRCPDALAAFAAGEPATEAAAAAAYLGCLHAAGRDGEARTFAAGLTPPVARAEAVKKALAAIPAAKPAALEEVEAATAPAGDAAADHASAAPDPQPAPAAEAPDPDPLTGAERDAVEAARQAIGTVVTRAELERHLAAVRPVAAARPADAGLQRLLATLAYRAAEWPLCASAFAASGPAAADEPLLRFYRAVCLYESGDPAAAAAALGDAAPALKRTPFVERYLALIQPGATRP